MKYSLSIFIAGLATTAAVSVAVPVEWPLQSGGNGHWYEVRDEGQMPWTESQSRAVALGGHLATLTSAAESTFVASLVSTNRGVDIGGYQDRQGPGYSEPAGGWRWVTGEPWSFTNWLGGEPNNLGGSEDYLFFADIDVWGDKWGDGDDLCMPCLSHFFAVEWSADCNRDGLVDKGQILRGQLHDVNGNGVPDICEVPTCDADFNRDGSVDFFDYLDFVAAFADGQSNADVNGDNIVDFFDYLDFVVILLRGC